LELGGNNPQIVWGVSNPQAAARIVALGAWATSGQRCSCTRRLIVPAGPEGDQIVDRVLAVAGSLRVGLTDDEPEPFMGPLISERAADRVLEAQADLVSRGARKILEMKRLPRSAALVSPGILDVTSVTDRPDEEVFGPLLQVIRVDDLDAAFREANATRYGLTAGILTDDSEVFVRMERDVQAGVIAWNRPTTGASSALPFGGRGMSGNHRPGGYMAADYCSIATAVCRTAKLTDPAAPPGFPN
jgi:succinylglutamic semialdehyde dehydrogenase